MEQTSAQVRVKIIKIRNCLPWNKYFAVHLDTREKIFIIGQNKSASTETVANSFRIDQNQVEKHLKIIRYGQTLEKRHVVMSGSVSTTRPY